MTVPEAQRDRVITALREQAAEGRLDMDEFGQRLDEAYQASTVDELQHALRNLPVAPVVPPAQVPMRPRRPTGPVPQPPPAWVRKRHDAPGTVAKAAWHAHVATYLAVNLFLVVIWLVFSQGAIFWPMFPMFGWGIGLAAHGAAYNAKRSSYRNP